MISRKNRFRGHRSLDIVYKKGRTTKAGPLSMRYLSSQRGDYRLAVVVSKKVSKSAVKRNRIRRRVFELFRKEHKDQNKPLSYDVIISVFNEEVANMSADKLAKIFDKLLQNARLKS
ncbi:MAG TPA: ribonuclease P protein component [Candidatus Saccharimonadales bacterium]|nr:ribonuclease P protein component [Candidatus Saccharimonadales bacterium]